MSKIVAEVLHNSCKSSIPQKFHQLKVRVYHSQVQSGSEFYSKISAPKVLQETCDYIRSLHREVEDLSDRLSELLESTDSGSAQAVIIRSLLM
ncbi:hypothetical protein ACS0TY_005100 [Phlomoides rotata]